MELLSIPEYELLIMQVGNMINIKHQNVITKVIEEKSPKKMKEMCNEIDRIGKLYTRSK